MPPTNIEASAWTRQITSSGVNHRSPGESQMTRARSAASSPATRLRSEEARVRRAEDTNGTASSAVGGRGSDGGLIPCSMTSRRRTRGSGAGYLMLTCARDC